MPAKRLVTRSQTEKLVGEFQLELLRKAGYTSTWELYTETGASHCCGGIFRLRDAELRQTYRGLVEGIDQMDREGLLAAILDYERSRIGGDGLVTCQSVAQEGRVCDGLSRYSNEELAWWFPGVLAGCAVVDDREPTSALTPGQHRLLPSLFVLALIGPALFVLVAFLWP